MRKKIDKNSDTVIIEGSEHTLHSTNRRGFLKGAAAGAASAVALPHTQTARAAVRQLPVAALPTSAMVAAEAGPSPAGSPRIIEHPASDYMVDVFRSLDLEYVATNPGSSFKALHESLINYGGNQRPEILTCLHEESAVGMAHGYAKITGKPMMALLHGTVGLMHGSMAIFNAYADRVPIYIVSATHEDPAFWVNRYHSAQDMGALVREYVKWDAHSNDIHKFGRHALHAYKQALMPPRGPVLLTLNHHLQERPLPESERPPVPKLTLAAPPQGDGNAVREAARWLVQAERPLITTERCARTPEGINMLVELAELLQVPVTGGERIDFPWTHPLYGDGGPDYEPDVILGLEVNDMAGVGDSARKVIEISSAQLAEKTNILSYGRYAEVDLSLAADAQATLPALIEEVGKQLTAERRRALQARGEQIRTAHVRRRRQEREQACYGWTASPVSTARLSAELWAQIRDDDWSLVSWQGFISGWPGKLWAMEKQHHYIGGYGAGGMGYNAQAAVGAALANKKHGRLSINIQGDGDLNYAPGVLWTAAHHQIPLLTVMHNNRAYHAEVMYVQQQCSVHNRGHDMAHIGTAIRDPDIDYAKMAQSYGMYAEGPIDDPAELGKALKRGLERVRAGEPALIDVRTQPR